MMPVPVGPKMLSQDKGLVDGLSCHGAGKDQQILYHSTISKTANNRTRIGTKAYEFCKEVVIIPTVPPCPSA